MQPSGPVPAYDLRITLENTEPLIWRRLQVPATLSIPEFHLAVQAVFGWENRHLYDVRGTDLAGKPRTIIGPDDATEDLDAEPASGVVLSELLDARKPGTEIEYEYDFGDSWTHRVELLGAAELAAGELKCVDGANRGPLEDSGGPHGNARLLQIVADPQHPEHEDATFWIYKMTGAFGANFDPADFDRNAANRKLRLLSLQWWPQPLTDDERDAVLRPVLWLLENASPDGLELTKDGYLKPATVQRAMDELGWTDPLMGKGNRETNAVPVRELREHLMEWKLLRKYKGRLLLTPRGKRGLEQPSDLWNYLVDTVGQQDHDAVRLVTGLYTEWHLNGVAPPSGLRPDVIVHALQATGFVTRSGHQIPREWASDINQKVRRTFKCLGLLEPKADRWRRSLLTDGGVKFLLAVRAVVQPG
jgi:hypothetical protein